MIYHGGTCLIHILSLLIIPGQEKTFIRTFLDYVRIGLKWHGPNHGLHDSIPTEYGTITYTNVAVLYKLFILSASKAWNFHLINWRFGCLMPLLFWYFLVHTLHSYYTIIRRHSPRFLSISSSLVNSEGKTSLGCRAENRTRACLTVCRRHLSYAAP